MSSGSRPWQLDWKRPMWHSPDTDDDNDDDIKNGDTITNKLRIQGRVVDHCAAAVLRQEVILPAEAATGTDDDDEEEEDDEMPVEESYILSVTLVQSHENDDDEDEKDSVADIMVMEVLRQAPQTVSHNITSRDAAGMKADEEGILVSKFERVESRVLRWPAAALEEQPHVGWDWSMLVGWISQIGRPPPNQTHHRDNKNKKKQNTVGMVGACLCRLPADYSTAVRAEALDVLSLLALGHQHNITQRGFKLNEESKATVSFSSTHSALDAEAQQCTALVLACLTSNGKVYFYDPLKLLHPIDRDQDADQINDGMAHFLLGDNLLSALRTSMLPLSQPTKKITLSLPFLETGVPSTESSGGGQKQQQRGSRGELSVWDPAMWDSLLDKASLPFQTKENIATNCIAALDFVCIAGRGCRRRRLSSPVRESEVTTLPAASSQEEKSENFDDLASLPQQDEIAPTSSVSSPDSKYNGGFVTFISLQSYSEVRTVYLPFVPEKLFPILWGGMSFVMVVGSSRAVLIRSDMSSAQFPAVMSGEAPPPLADNNHSQDAKPGPSTSSENKVAIPIHRFQILPIQLSEADMKMASRIVGSGPTSATTPAIAFWCRNGSFLSLFQRTLHSIDASPPDALFSRYRRRVSTDRLGVVTTMQSMAHVARIKTDSEIVGEPWCHLGLGYCLLGTNEVVYFICFEGGTSTTGAYVHPLFTKVPKPYAGGHACDILPLDPFARRKAVDSKEEWELPLTKHFGKTARFLGLRDEGLINDREGDTLNDIVLEALDDISDSSYRNEVVVACSPRSAHRRSSSFSPSEKFVRLLKHCSSWKQLEDSQTGKERFEQQLSCISVRLGAGTDAQYSVSLRKNAVPLGAATPFQRVLSWLCSREDYFTAASLALDLLRDSQSLRHLWKAYDKFDNEDEMSMLEGLLDGVLPLQTKDEIALQMTTTQLADMTAACLIKGGIRMSSTLNHFLRTNVNYDPSRICLMLSAVTSTARSTLRIQVSTGEELQEENDLETVLWPVRSLLEVGMARDSLVTAILLLNATIPDELRCRKRTDVAVPPQPSLELCKALISLIVSSSQHATLILLNLIDEKSRRPFWESLDHTTCLELSLLDVKTSFPLLRHVEVRSWIIRELLTCLESQGPSNLKSNQDWIPDEWLRRLVLSCLSNAGCSLADNPEPSIKNEWKYADLTPENNPLKCFEDETSWLRQALLPTPGSGGIDFDIVIASLLLLEMRRMKWHSTSPFSTQSVLNMACDLAGRRNTEAPAFAMDAATLMKECFLANNVQAGAKLIGGKNGLILECCHVLNKDAGMNIDEAELFVLSDTWPTDSRRSQENKNNAFAIDSSHLILLWLLHDHVLCIRKYGDFDSAHSRGKVDPVFACRAVLRTWWCLTRPHLSEATNWLTKWLEAQLCFDTPDEGNTDEEEKVQLSPHRLACAALVRALIWPSEDSVSSEDALASRLKIPNRFVLRLSLSCCGLVETLPSHVVEDTWKQMVGARILTSSKGAGPHKSTSASNLRPVNRGNDTSDNSFRSTVSSLDMDG